MKVLITKEQIAEKVAELAAKINRDYEGKEVDVVVILKGAFIFAADLLRQITVPVRTDFITLGSYDGTKSTGKVRVGYFGSSKADRHILVIEDIIDTGNTVEFLKEIPTLKDAASIKTCCLIDKETARKNTYTPDYIGFKIPDLFVVGYGMDVDQKFRNLPDICIYEEK